MRKLNIVNFIPQTLAHRQETDKKLIEIDKDIAQLYEQDKEIKDVYLPTQLKRLGK